MMGRGRNDQNHQTQGKIRRSRHDWKHLKQIECGRYDRNHQKNRWDAVSMTQTELTWQWLIDIGAAQKNSNWTDMTMTDRYRCGPEKLNLN